MKREFGKKLIEEFFQKIDLTHVIDTSGAYIPGHGTPTVILFGRRRLPRSESSIRAALGIRGEPKQPEIPAKGHVWQAIVNQIDQPGSESEWISVADIRRTTFAKHPWSLSGGGAAVNLETLRSSSNQKSLGDRYHCQLAGQIRPDAMRHSFARCGPPGCVATVALTRIVPLVQGEAVRDWRLSGHD